MSVASMAVMPVFESHCRISKDIRGLHSGKWFIREARTQARCAIHTNMRTMAVAAEKCSVATLSWGWFGPNKLRIERNDGVAESTEAAEQIAAALNAAGYDPWEARRNRA